MRRIATPTGTTSNAILFFLWLFFEPFSFVASLGLLALLTVFVVLALVLDGNRPKALRVGLAAATYLAILVARGIAAGPGSAAGGEATRAIAAALPSIRVFLLASGAHVAAGACMDWRMSRSAGRIAAVVPGSRFQK